MHRNATDKAKSKKANQANVQHDKQRAHIGCSKDEFGNDQQTVADIAQTTPHKSYTTLDAEFSDSIQKAEVISLQFARVYFDLNYQVKILL